MFNRRIIRDDEYARLLSDIELWRKAFESERARADRLHDSVMASIGRPHISDENVGEMRRLNEQVRQTATEMSEIFDNDDGDDSPLAEFLDEKEKVELATAGAAR